MSHPICLHDKASIEAFLRRQPHLHLYAIGDLDDFFWPYTTWYATEDAAGDIREIALVYTGTDLPVLLALSADVDGIRDLIRRIRPFLPPYLHAHISGDAVDALTDSYEVEPFGLHYKMALTDPARLDSVDTAGVVQFSDSDGPALERYYAAAYPGNWFDTRMLETGQYFGVRHTNGADSADIVSVAGIHVYSPRYGVAALGNITTDPAWRGRGLGTAVTARLCQSLRESVAHIGLNVKADNAPAIAAYRKVGFSVVAEYNEYSLRYRGG